MPDTASEHSANRSKRLERTYGVLQKAAVAALLHQDALLHNCNDVSVLNGGQPVSDNNSGAPNNHAVQSILQARETAKASPD